MQAHDLRGIVNGIDYDEYNPETDRYIVKNYNAKNFRKEKVKNKRALQEELGLEKDDKKFMIGIVSRLTDQKGFDLIAYMMDEMCQQDVQFVVSLEPAKRSMRICSAISHGNIRAKYLQTSSILKQCLIRYMHLAMHS